MKMAKEVQGRAVRNTKPDHVFELKEELRIISMEYADIRSRIEATDILIDHLLKEIEREARQRTINLLLTVLILALISVIIIMLSLA
jgi:hypothetical protein